MTLATVLGALLGGRLAAHLPAGTLRTGFGWFILFTASLVLAEQIAPTAGIVSAATTLTAAALTLMCTRYARCPLRRLAHW